MSEPDEIRRVRIEYTIHVPNANHFPTARDRDPRTLDRLVAEAVRRELQRTRRV